MYPTRKVIDIVKRASPGTRLVGFKFLAGATEPELRAAARHLMDRAGADMVFANTLETYRDRAGTMICRDWTETRMDGDGDARLLAALICGFLL